MKFLAFEPTSQTDEFGWTSGLATVQLHDETRKLRATDFGDRVTFYGLAVRYRTGTKIWQGSASYWKATQTIGSLMGGLDNRQRSKTISLVGFYDQASEKVRSRHNGA